MNANKTQFKGIQRYIKSRMASKEMHMRLFSLQKLKELFAMLSPDNKF